jgi:hypothetical protein
MYLRKMVLCAAAVAASGSLFVMVPATASAAPAASVSCSKHIGRTVGTITCTSSGGTYTFSDVYADCASQSDPHRGAWSINGTSTQRFECAHSIRNIYAVS